MRYLSTRGLSPAARFDEVVFNGLAPDGGLYLPEVWPELSVDAWRALRGRSYVDVAVAVLAPFVTPSLDEPTLRRLCEAAWAGFSAPEVAPLRPLGDLWLLELFHGPTLAFKDLALQLLGQILDHLLTMRGGRVTVVGATSGDTGSAAIAACARCAGVDVFILHPAGRTSEVQRRQMTTVIAPNVFNIAVHGTFDDCQAITKAMFLDPDCRSGLGMMAVNSISWARVAAQIVYYATAALALGAPDEAVDFVVPTGNFGDVFAGWCARRMGLGVGRLVVATNQNDILPVALASGRYARGGVNQTLSPSMDIQVSSNFERALFEASGRDASRVRAWMDALARDGAFQIDADALAALRGWFEGGAVDDDTTLATIAAAHRAHGELLDPHTAVGVAVALRRPRQRPTVVLATAHPAKFAEAVVRATGLAPALPPALADLGARPERYVELPADAGAVSAWILSRARRGGAAGGAALPEGRG